MSSPTKYSDLTERERFLWDTTFSGVFASYNTTLREIELDRCSEYSVRTLKRIRTEAIHAANICAMSLRNMADRTYCDDDNEEQLRGKAIGSGDRGDQDAGA